VAGSCSATPRHCHPASATQAPLAAHRAFFIRQLMHIVSRTITNSESFIPQATALGQVRSVLGWRRSLDRFSNCG